MEDVERRLSAILSADVVDYTRLMAADEESTVQTLAGRVEIMTAEARAQGGRIVNAVGDNVLAEFPSASGAVACALAIQARIAEGNADLSPERQMWFRIGLHLGEVRIEGDRIHGDGVNIAARLEALAETGGICVSAAILDQVRNKLEVRVEDLGERELKNVPRPVRVYRIGEGHDLPGVGRTRAGSSRGRAWGIAAAAVALLLVGGVLFSNPPAGPPAVAAAVAAPASQRAIAVLPFVDMSPSGDQEYFADGLSEEIIHALARGGQLNVASRTSAFAFKGLNQDIRSIGSQLGVGTVLEGSVRKADERVRVTAQLIRASDGFHLWSETFDRRLADIFVIQEEIAQAIREALEVQISTRSIREPARPSSGNVRAYDLALRARALWFVQTEAAFRESIGILEEAVSLDPDYAFAHAGLAIAHMSLWARGFERKEAVLERAEAEARRAAALDPDLPHAWATLGHVLAERGDPAGMAALERAIRLSPSYSGPRITRAYLLAEAARMPDALEEIGHALASDPLNPIVQREAGRIYLAAGQLDEAIGRLERSRELNPQEPDAPFWLWQAHLVKGETERATEAILLLGPAFSRRPMRLGSRVFGHGFVLRMGLQWEALRSGRACSERPYAAALMRAALDEPDAMFECLEELEDTPTNRFAIRSDPLLRNYREDARWLALVGEDAG